MYEADSCRNRSQQRDEPGPRLAIGGAVDPGRAPMALEGADRRGRRLVIDAGRGAVVAEAHQAGLQREDGRALFAGRQACPWRGIGLGPQTVAGFSEPLPWEELAGVELAVGRDVRMSQDAPIGHAPAP